MPLQKLWAILWRADYYFYGDKSAPNFGPKFCFLIEGCTWSPLSKEVGCSNFSKSIPAGSYFRDSRVVALLDLFQSCLQLGFMIATPSTLYVVKGHNSELDLEIASPKHSTINHDLLETS
jgi:hypothetical protein